MLNEDCFFCKIKIMKMTLTGLGFVCSLGNDLDSISKNAACCFTPGLCQVATDIPNKEILFFKVLSSSSQRMRCYHLLDLAIDQILDDLVKLEKKYDSSELGIVLGCSNTGIHEAQIDIQDWLKQEKCPEGFSFEKIELGSPAIYLKKKLGFMGPAYVVSTACSSSAKAFQSARNLIQNKVCKAVVVGGVDSQCMFAHNGFYALSALSNQVTNPFSCNRSGITLGEGAALFIMEEGGDGIQVLGIGESSDTYDLTAPDPTGNGALLSMKRALSEANLSARDIDFINLHGTGTEANDAMEGNAIHALFGNSVLCASTKQLTGHTLGASGAIELALSWLMLKNNFIIPHKFDGMFDDKIPQINLATGKEQIELKNILSNSFAFGGSNVSVILGVGHNG